MLADKCHLCGKILTTEDDPYSCLCRKCENIELIDRLPDGADGVEDEKYMTD
jgi:hypothetical protein